MKILQKATLAAAIAVAPFAAQAELKAMDDASMSATTGQAGVTIDVKLAAGTGASAAVRVGEVAYTDTATLSDPNDATSSVADIDTTGNGTADTKSGGGVSIKGISVGTPSATTLTQTIDVTEDGDLFMTMTGASVVVGVDSVSLTDKDGGAAGGNLVDTVSLSATLGNSTTTIGANSNRTTQIAASDGQTGSNVDGNTLVIDSVSVVELTDGSLNALNGNVGVSGLKFYNGSAGNGATISQTIWADNNGVNIKVNSIQGTLEVGSVSLGGSSIGSLAVSNINLAGVTQTISGH